MDLSQIGTESIRQGNQNQWGVWGDRDWITAVADDIVPGVSYIEKFGLNAATASGDVIEDLSRAVNIRTTDSTIEVISTGANASDDAPAGTGAEAIEVFGCDINWNPISETIITNGASASSPSTQKFLYVYRARIVDSGAQRNKGTITIRDSGGAGDDLAAISLNGTTGYGQTNMAIFPVFAGCKLYLRIVRSEGSKTGTLTGTLGLTAYYLNEGIRVVHPITFDNGDPRNVDWKHAAKVFPEKTLVWVEALDISTGASIGASFDGIIVRHRNSSV